MKSWFSGFKRTTILIIIIVVGITTIVPTGFVVAQSIPGVGSPNAVPVNSKAENDKLDVISTGINGRTSGLLGQAQGVLASTVSKAKSSISKTCLTIINQASSLGEATFLKSLSASNVGLIGGSDTEAIMNSTQASALKASADCMDAYVNALSSTPTLNLQDATETQREQITFAGIRDTLRKRYDDAMARASASWKDVLKAFMVKTILSINKTLTTELVNKMISKYKISDFQAYGDALASQVYSMKYISDNYSGSAEQQLMIRSILQSPKIPSKISTVTAMANSQAETYIGKACNTINGASSQDDPMYYINCVAALGSPKASKDYIISEAVDGASAATAAGKASASAEVSQSNGYAPPRNCSGSIAQQQQIDTQVDSAALALKNAKAILQKLQTSKQTGIIVADADIAKAQAAVDQAQANYNALMKKFDAGGGGFDEVTGKAKSGAIINVCEAIASPASFVANSLGDFLKQHLDQTSQLKSDNLPFYLNFLSDVTSNFLTNILTGGKSTTQVLKEAGIGALNGTLIGIAQTSNSGSAKSQPYSTGDVKIYARPANGTTQTTSLVAGQAYVLVVNFKDLIATSMNTKDPVFNPYRLELTGASSLGDAGGLLSAAEIAAGNVAFDFTPAKAGSFTIKAQFYANHKLVPQSGPEDIPLNTSGGWKQEFIVAGAVAGANTIVPSVSLMPRGPAPTFR